MDQKLIWDRKYVKVKHTSPNEFAYRALSWVKKFRPNARSVLDLGCGSGRDTLLFAKGGFRTTGIDFSENAIRHARASGKKYKKLAFDLRDATKRLRLGSNSLDVVYAHLSLHYFDNKTTHFIFKEIRRVLKPNGILMLRVKSTKDEKYGMGLGVERDYYELEGHRRHFFSAEYTGHMLAKFKILLLRETEDREYPGEAFIEAVAQKKR